MEINLQRQNSASDERLTTKFRQLNAAFMQQKETIETLRQKLLEAKAEDAEAYGSAWNKLESDDPEVTEDLFRAVQELRGSVSTEGGGPLCQSADIQSVEVLRAAADTAGPKLHAFGNAVVAQCGGGLHYKGAPTKGEARIREKIRTDYGGDCRRIIDAARGSIVCETLAELTATIRVLLSGGQGVPTVVRVKDRLSQPVSGGYRDVMLNVEMDGHVCELQLHLKALIAIKSQAHRIYGILRSVGWEEEGG